MQKITIKCGNTILHACLNDTLAAKDFSSRLPFVVSGFDSGIDYCCMAASGIFDPTQVQNGWKNGDISLAGGRFALLYKGEEQSSSYRNVMVIGNILKEDMEMIKTLPQEATFVIALDKE